MNEAAPSAPSPGAGGPVRPLRDGVGASRVALPEGPWATIEAFLQERFPAVDAGEWQARVARGDVTDERGAPIRPGQRYAAHQRLYYYRSLPAEARLAVREQVIHRDEDLLVADKPHGLPVIPSGPYLHETLLVRLRRLPGCEQLAPMHRLDRETAGLVLLGLRPSSRGAYQALFAERRIDKVYEAVAPLRAGLRFPLIRRSRIVPGTSFMQMQEAPGEPNSETAIALITALPGGLGHFRLLPRTGRKHQLRVHMAALGMPILHDTLYPRLQSQAEAAAAEQPLQLLARALSVVDPRSGRVRHFESRLRLALAEPAG